MQETLVEQDLIDYSNSANKEKEAYLNKSADIIKQYLLLKNNIIETLKDTFLFPYLLEMDYLVGEYEGLKVSDSPMETLGYFNMRNGVKELMGIEMDINLLQSWNVFRLKIPIKDKYQQINYFKVYLFLKIRNNTLDYFLFSEYQGKIFVQEITLNMLDKQPNIIKIQGLINDGRNN